MRVRGVDLDLVRGEDIDCVACDNPAVYRGRHGLTVCRGCLPDVRGLQREMDAEYAEQAGHYAGDWRGVGGCSGSLNRRDPVADMKHAGVVDRG